MPINAASILSRHNPHLFAFVVRFAAKKTSFLGGTRLSFCKSSGFMCDMFKTWHIVVIHPIKIKKKTYSWIDDYPTITGFTISSESNL